MSHVLIASSVLTVVSSYSEVGTCVVGWCRLSSEVWLSILFVHDTCSANVEILDMDMD